MSVDTHVNNLFSIGRLANGGYPYIGIELEAPKVSSTFTYTGYPSLNDLSTWWPTGPGVCLDLGGASIDLNDSNALKITNDEYSIEYEFIINSAPANGVTHTLLDIDDTNGDLIYTLKAIGTASGFDLVSTFHNAPGYVGADDFTTTLSDASVATMYRVALASYLIPIGSIDYIFALSTFYESATNVRPTQTATTTFTDQSSNDLFVFAEIDNVKVADAITGSSTADITISRFLLSSGEIRGAWMFCENTGAKVYDVSANGNHLSIPGGALWTTEVAAIYKDAHIAIAVSGLHVPLNLVTLTTQTIVGESYTDVGLDELYFWGVSGLRDLDQAPMISWYAGWVYTYYDRIPSQSRRVEDAEGQSPGAWSRFSYNAKDCNQSFICGDTISQKFVDGDYSVSAETINPGEGAVLFTPIELFERDGDDILIQTLKRTTKITCEMGATGGGSNELIDTIVIGPHNLPEDVEVAIELRDDSEGDHTISSNRSSIINVAFPVHKSANRYFSDTGWGQEYFADKKLKPWEQIAVIKLPVPISVNRAVVTVVDNSGVTINAGFLLFGKRFEPSETFSRGISVNSKPNTKHDPRSDGTHGTIERAADVLIDMQYEHLNDYSAHELESLIQEMDRSGVIYAELFDKTKNGIQRHINRGFLRAFNWGGSNYYIPGTTQKSVQFKALKVTGFIE